MVTVTLLLKEADPPTVMLPCSDSPFTMPKLAGTNVALIVTLLSGIVNTPFSTVTALLPASVTAKAPRVYPKSGTTVI